MGEQENRDTIDRLVRGLNEEDLDLFHAQFHTDSVMTYPQSGERIVGDENRRGVYGAFPKLPKVAPQRVLVNGDLGVLEAKLDYGDDVDWWAILVFEFSNGKIARETAFWAQPFPAADWRAAWVEPPT